MKYLLFHIKSEKIAGIFFFLGMVGISISAFSQQVQPEQIQELITSKVQQGYHFGIIRSGFVFEGTDSVLIYDNDRQKVAALVRGDSLLANVKKRGDLVVLSETNLMAMRHEAGPDVRVYSVSKEKILASFYSNGQPVEILNDSTIFLSGTNPESMTGHFKVVNLKSNETIIPVKLNQAGFHATRLDVTHILLLTNEMRRVKSIYGGYDNLVVGTKCYVFDTKNRTLELIKRIENVSSNPTPGQVHFIRIDDRHIGFFLDSIHVQFASEYYEYIDGDIKHISADLGPIENSFSINKEAYCIQYKVHNEKFEITNLANGISHEFERSKLLRIPRSNRIISASVSDDNMTLYTLVNHPAGTFRISPMLILYDLKNKSVSTRMNSILFKGIIIDY